MSGPPPEVILNIPVGRNRNELFYLNSSRNFRNLWHNGKHPKFPFIEEERRYAPSSLADTVEPIPELTPNCALLVMMSNYVR